MENNVKEVARGMPAERGGEGEGSRERGGRRGMGRREGEKERGGEEGSRRRERGRREGRQER